MLEGSPEDSLSFRATVKLLPGQLYCRSHQRQNRPRSVEAPMCHISKYWQTRGRFYYTIRIGGDGGVKWYTFYPMLQLNFLLWRALNQTPIQNSLDSEPNDAQRVPVLVVSANPTLARSIKSTRFCVSYSSRPTRFCVTYPEVAFFRRISRDHLIQDRQGAGARINWAVLGSGHVTGYT